MIIRALPAAAAALTIAAGPMPKAGTAQPRQIEPPIIASPNWASGSPRVIHAIYAEPQPRVVDLGLAHSYRWLIWAGDHRHALAASTRGGKLVVLAYDPATGHFGAPRALWTIYGHGKVRYGVPESLAGYDWSADMRTLAYVDRQRWISLLDLRNGRVRRIVRLSPRNLEVDNWAPDVRVSPDGRLVAYSVQSSRVYWLDPGIGPDDLWIVRADGSRRRKLGHGSGPCWSHDGRYILAIAGEGHTLVRYTVTSGERRILRDSRDDVFYGEVYGPGDRYVAVEGPYGRHDAGYGLFLATAGGRFVRLLVPLGKYGIVNDRLSW